MCARKIVAVFVVPLVLVASVVWAQLPPKAVPGICQDGAFVVHWLGIVRDDGVPAATVREALQDPNFNGIRSVPKETVQQLAEIVFRHAGTGVIDLVRAFHAECMDKKGIQV